MLVQLRHIEELRQDDENAERLKEKEYESNILQRISRERKTRREKDKKPIMLAIEPAHNQHAKGGGIPLQRDEDYLYKKIEETYKKDHQASQEEQIKNVLAERRKRIV